MTDSMSYAEAISIVTMPHIPCTFENVITVAKASLGDSRQLTSNHIHDLEALVDSIHDLQAASARMKKSNGILAHLSKAVGIEDVTYREVKEKLIGKLWPEPVFNALKQQLSAFLHARSRVLFNAAQSSGVDSSLQNLLIDGHSRPAGVRTTPTDSGVVGGGGGSGGAAAAAGSSSGSSQSNGSSVARSRMKGRLIVRIVQAQELAALDPGGSSDPYCILSLEIPATAPNARVPVRAGSSSRGSTPNGPHRRSSNNKSVVSSTDGGSGGDAAATRGSVRKGRRVSIGKMAGDLWRKISSGGRGDSAQKIEDDGIGSDAFGEHTGVVSAGDHVEDPAVLSHDLYVDRFPGGGRRTRLKLAQTKALRQTLSPVYDNFTHTLHLTEDIMSLLDQPLAARNKPRSGDDDSPVRTQNNSQYRGAPKGLSGFSRLSMRVRNSFRTAAEKSKEDSDTAQLAEGSNAGSMAATPRGDFETSSKSRTLGAALDGPQVICDKATLRFSWFDKDFLQADEFLGSCSIPLRDFVDPDADDYTQLLCIDTDKFAALTGDRNLLNEYLQTQKQRGEDDPSVAEITADDIEDTLTDTSGRRRLVVAKNRWYNLKSSSASQGRCHIQSIFIPAPRYAVAEMPLNVKSQPLEDDNHVELFPGQDIFSSTRALPDPDIARQVPRRSVSATTPTRACKLTNSALEPLRESDGSSADVEPRTPKGLRRTHTDSSLTASVASYRSKSSSGRSGDTAASRATFRSQKASEGEVSRNFQCVSATQGECAALRTAVESMFSAPFLPAQAIFKGHSSSSPSHQEAQQQQQSPSARAARQASVGHTATDSASVWNLVHRFGEAVDWQQWDRCGFPLEPDLRGQWAIARSVEDCDEARQLEKWWAAGGFAAVTRALQTRRHAASLPSAQQRAATTSSHLDPELFWNGIPHQMRKGVYLRVMQLTRDEVIASIARAAREADGLAENGENPIESWTTADTEQAGLAYYNHLVARAKVELPLALRHQISIDIPRTFPDTKTALSSSQGRTALRNVLHAYAIRNPVLGYCQSLNFVVGFLLAALGCSEEEAFWLLVALAESIVPGYYVTTMQGVVTDCRVIERCIEEVFPIVGDHMQKLCVSVEALATSPLMSLYILSLPSMTALRLLDVVFADRFIPGQGSQVLIGVVLALVRRNRTQLLQADGLPEFCDIFRDAQRRCYDCSTLLRAARSELALVRKRRALGGVTKLRDDLQVQVADSLESRRYEVVMQKLCPPESTIRQNLFFEIRATHRNKKQKRKRKDEVRANIGRGGKHDPMQPYWDAFMANASAVHGFVVGPGGLGANCNVRQGRNSSPMTGVGTPLVRKPRNTLRFGRRPSVRTLQAAAAQAQSEQVQESATKLRARQEIVDYRRLDLGEFKAALQQNLIIDEDLSEQVGDGLVDIVKLASKIGFCRRRRRHQYKNSPDGGSSTPSSRAVAPNAPGASLDGIPTTRSLRSASLKDSDFLQRVYDIEIEDPLLNADAMFEAFDLDGVGSISVEQFMCGVAIISLGQTWTVAHRLNIACRLFDRSGSGGLPLSDVRRLLVWLHALLQTDCTAAEIESMGNVSAAEPESDSDIDGASARQSRASSRTTGSGDEEEVFAAATDGGLAEAASPEKPLDLASTFRQLVADERRSRVGTDRVFAEGFVSPKYTDADAAGTAETMSHNQSTDVDADPSQTEQADSAVPAAAAATAAATAASDDMEAAELSFSGVLRLVKLQPRLQTHLCTLRETTTHSHTISLAEHSKVLDTLKEEHRAKLSALEAEHSRLVEYFRSQTLLHLQTIDQLNKDVRVNREEHSAALQHTERESERERARHLQREQELLTLLSAQEQRNSDLMHQLRAAQQQLEQTGAAAPPAIADTDRDEHVADAAPVDAATTKLPQAGLARDPEPESERENNAANVEVAEAF